MKRVQTVAIPQNTWLTNILTKFKKPKFNNEKKLPLIRYALFCIACGLAATLFFNYNIGIQAPKGLISNWFVIYMLWCAWFYFIANPNLQDKGLILIECGMLINQALETSGRALHPDIKIEDISMLLLWFKAASLMFVCYLVWMFVANSERKPPSETS